MKEAIIKIFEDSAAVKIKFARENADKIVEVVQLIAQAFREGKKLLIFGNGGSATDASHIAAEFVNRFLMERPPASRDRAEHRRRGPDQHQQRLRLFAGLLEAVDRAGP